MTGRQRGPGRGSLGDLARYAALFACLGLATGSAVADGPAVAVATPVDPIRAEVDLQRGILDFQKGRYEDALRRLDGIEAAVPGASYYRGLSLLGLRRPDEALRAFDRLRQTTGSSTEADLGTGVARLSLGDAAGAESSLDAYLKARPDDPHGHYLLGLAQRRQGRLDDAQPHLDRAAADPAVAPYLVAYKALVESVDAEAEDGAPAPLPALPPPTLAEVAPATTGPRVDTFSRLSSQPGGPGTIPGPGMTGVDGQQTGPGNPDRRYNLAIVNGYEFDSNVALAPSIALSGLGAINQRQDSRYLIASFGEYRFVQRQDLVAGLLGATFDTFQFRLPQFNIQDYMGGAYANVALGRFILGGRYEFHETLLGGKQFTTDHRVTPNLTLREGTVGHFTAFYEYEAVNVTGLALVPAQRRSGDINAVGATQAFYLAKGNGRLFLNYRYENAQTQGTDFARSTNQISARLELPIPGKAVFNTEFRQFFDDYKHPNSLDFLGRPRYDQRIEARIGIQKFLTENLSLRLDYIYTNNDSNVENLFDSSFFSYHRNVFSTQLIYDF